MPTATAGRSLLSALRAAPSGALIFGLGGLIPFIAISLGLILKIGNIPVLSAALVTYGAVILSFLGGIRWGFAVAAQRGSPSPLEFGLSILPALLAWWAMFMPLPLAYAVLGGAIAVWFIVERVIPSPAALPGWYVALRAILTFGAASSLVLAAVFW